MDEKQVFGQDQVAKPTIGRILIYKLTEKDVEQISIHRKVLSSSVTEKDKWPLALQAHIGNPHSAGQELPLIVCVVWPNEYCPNWDGVNGQVLLDGNDTLWVTSVKQGQESGQWRWPVKN